MLFLTAALFITGCVNKQSNDVSEETIIIDSDSMEEEPVISYDVPDSLPRVLINQLGYNETSIKKAIFIGDNIPDEFIVVDALTNESIYSAKIANKSYSEQYKTNVAFGEFSEITENGTYYITADYLGRSYDFSIGSNIYNGLFETVLNSFSDAILVADPKDFDDILSNSEAIGYALLACELFENDMTPAFEAVETYINALANEITAEDTLFYENTNYEEILATSFLFAKYSYLAKDKNEELSRITYSLAKKLYDTAVLDTDNEDKLRTLKFAAAAEIYRVSADKNSENYLETYFENDYGGLKDSFELLGAISYLNCHQKVNNTYCEFLMQHLLSKASEIASKTHDPLTFIMEDNDESCSYMLDEMTRMTIVDYVIPSREYDRVLEEYLSYFLGRNKSALSFVGKTGIINNAKLLFMLSSICEN